MRKNYLLTVVMAVLVSVVCAQPAMRKSLLDGRTAGMRSQMKRVAKTHSTTSLSGKRAVLKAADGYDTFIRTQPEGKHYPNMAKSTHRFEDSFGYLYDAYYSMLATDIVETDDAIYIHDPFSLGTFGFDRDYWLKGEMAADGTVTVKPQPIFSFAQEDEDGNPLYDEDGNPVMETLYATRMKMTQVYDEEWDEYYTELWAVEDNPEVKFVWKDGTLVMEDLPEDELFGLAFDDGYFADVAEREVTIKQLDVEKVTLPAGLQTEDWQMRFKNNGGYEDGGIVKLAVDGNDMYMGGLPGDMSGAWIKGTVNGDKVEFPSGQYLGIDTDNMSYTFFFGGYVGEAWDDEYEEYVEKAFLTDKVTFDYDADGKTLKTEEGIAINLGNETAGFMALLQAADMRPYTLADSPATPQDPVFVDFNPYSEDWMIGNADFLLPRFDAEGNFLDPAKMYYNVYYDDELVTFYPDETPGLEEETTDMPVLFTNYETLFSNGSFHTVCFFDGGFDKFGVQLFYTGGGETRSSKIVYYEDPENMGIGNSLADGAGRVTGVSYADMSGRKVSHPVKGLYVKSLKMADGTVKHVKVVVK